MTQEQINQIQSRTSKSSINVQYWLNEFFKHFNRRPNSNLEIHAFKYLQLFKEIVKCTNPSISISEIKDLGLENIARGIYRSLQFYNQTGKPISMDEFRSLAGIESVLPELRKKRSESSKRAKTNVSTSRDIVYKLLKKHFSSENIHVNPQFNDSSNERFNFLVKTTPVNFAVDTISPTNTRSLSGCLNDKVSKYRLLNKPSLPVIFVQTNVDIPHRSVKLNLSSNFKVMWLDEFKDYLKTNFGNR